MSAYRRPAAYSGGVRWLTGPWPPPSGTAVSMARRR